MDRRQFSIAIASSVLGPGVATGSSVARGRLASPSMSPVGLQLYTVRDRMRVDVRATLRTVAEIGYRDVEFAGYFGHTASQIRTLLEEFRLRSTGTHVSLEDIRNNLDETLAYARAVGHEYLIVPWLPEAERTPQGYIRLADEFNRVGELCRSQDLTLGYHNHAFGFDGATGPSGFDVLLRGTEPGLVVFEVDLFWMVTAQANPLEYFANYPDRFRLCHVKDMDGNGQMVDVGAGILDFGELLTVGKRHGLLHFFVEHDQPVDSLESIRTSYQFLSRLPA